MTAEMLPSIQDAFVPKEKTVQCPGRVSMLSICVGSQVTTANHVRFPFERSLLRMSFLCLPYKLSGDFIEPREFSR
jgi:hypothetical protein